MKKFIALLLALVMVMGLVACGGGASLLGNILFHNSIYLLHLNINLFKERILKKIERNHQRKKNKTQIHSYRKVCVKASIVYKLDLILI